MNETSRILSSIALFLLAMGPSVLAAESLNVHGIFRSNMVLQRDKPITVWGWAPAGTEVSVSLGKHSAVGKAAGEKGRWEVVFDPQAANGQGQALKVQAAG